jgi:two-component system, OmpR family, sensor histidine kinase KdpD
MADTIAPTEARLLVCVSPSASSARLINAAKRMATDLHAEWFVAYVEQPRTAMLPEAVRNQAADNLRLAADLGAEAVTLSGRNIAEEIARFARQRNATRIIVGKPKHSFGKGILSRNPVDQLLRISGDVDVYVIAGEPGEQREAGYVIRPERVPLSDYGAAVLYLVLATLACFAMYPYFHLSNLIMVYLLGVMLTATECGRGPAILSSLLSVLAFDFFFVPPRFSFNVDEAQYIVTFVVMCLVGLVISHLAAGMRQQATLARLQERQAEAMHGLSRQLASTRGVEKILEVAVRYISEIFDGEVLAMLPDEKHKLRVAAGDVSSVIQSDVVKHMGVARSAYETGQMAGWGTGSSPATEVLYVPLQAADTTAGVLALRPRDPERFLLREQVTLLESLARQVALALEVELLSLGRSSHQGHTA